jgi:hypothetical protein
MAVGHENVNPGYILGPFCELRLLLEKTPAMTVAVMTSTVTISPAAQT